MDGDRCFDHDTCSDHQYRDLFSIWLIGFLIITEFFVVTTLRPKSARWQRLIGIAGVGIFAFIIIIKIVEIIAK